MPGLRRHGHGQIVADHLIGDLVDDFRNHRIDLARHDGRAGLHGGQADFAKARARTGIQQAEIVTDFRELHGNAFQHTGKRDEGAGIGGRLDQVASRHEFDAGDGGEMADYRFGIVLWRVDAGADGGATEIDLAQQIGEFAQAVDVLAHHDGEGAEFGTQTHGHGIHELGAPHLDHVVEFDGLQQQSLFQRLLAGDQFRATAQNGEPHGGGIDIVGRLRQVHMVVGIDGGIVAARPAQKLQRDVGDDFVGIHVGGGTGPALQHVDHELAVSAAGDDQIAGRDDGRGNVGFQGSEIAVGHGRRLLGEGQRLDQSGIVTKGNAGDGEILDRAGRVDAVIGFGGNGHFTDRVPFHAHCRHRSISFARIMT